MFHTGKLTVLETNSNCFESSFDMDSLEELNTCYKSNKEFLLGNSQGRLIIYADKKYKVIKDIDHSGMPSKDLPLSPSALYKIKENSGISEYIKEKNSIIKMMTTTSSVTLNVPYRANAAINNEDIYTSYHSPLSYDSVIGILSTNMPIYMRLIRTGGSHAVALKGAVFTGGSSYYYLLMDSNISSTVSVVIPSYALSDGSLFTYAASYGYTYTWDYSIY